MLNTLPKRCSALTLLGLVSGMILLSTGCQLITAVAILVHPEDVTAESTALKGQRVAVVCDVLGLGFQDVRVPQEIAEEVGDILGKKVSRIEIISPKEVNDWTDANGQRFSYEELGEAVGADYVVAIELDRFNLYKKGRHVYQGNAIGSVTLHNIETGESDELDPVESIYPPEAGVPVDSSEGQFRRKYVAVLSDQISRRFYDHVSGDAFKIDTFYDID